MVLKPDLIAAIEANSALMGDLLSWWKWRETTEFDPAKAFERLYSNYAEFRSVCDYRFRQQKQNMKLLPEGRRATDLYIVCDEIGPGLRVQHGHSTWVLAECIGRNFHVYSESRISRI